VIGIRQCLAGRGDAAIEAFVQESAERADEPDFPRSAAGALIELILAPDADAAALPHEEEGYRRAARALMPSLMVRWLPDGQGLRELVGAAMTASNAPPQPAKSGAARAWQILADGAPDPAPPAAGELRQAIVNYTAVLDRDASTRWALTALIRCPRGSSMAAARTNVSRPPLTALATVPATIGGPRVVR